MNAKDIVAQNEKETRAGFGDGILEIARENKEGISSRRKRRTQEIP